MPLDLILGAQWGDEGKGRITDALARQAQIVARFSGGDNAGHTLTVGSTRLKLHLVPSGILHPAAHCVLASGMVINPATLIEELDLLSAHGLDTGPARISISPAAHLITPAHRLLDGAEERLRGAPIGTTGRGIGPAYTDKAARRGIRAGELRNWRTLAPRLRSHLEAAARLLEQVYREQPPDAEAVLLEFERYAERLQGYLVDTSAHIAEVLAEGGNVLGEGAQGTLLDLDHGTYPYVTSSHPTTAGALQSLGIGPAHVRRIIGVTKAFQTRVGAGPFPTEAPEPIAARLRGTGDQPWDEFGTTTGRPRRCGWLDGVLLRYTSRLNGFTELAVTKLDVLSGFESLPFATGYRFAGAISLTLPCSAAELDQCEPVYEELNGWPDDLRPIRDWQALPAAARSYIERIEAFTGVHVTTISVGPERQEWVERTR
ncbi:MAG: adenylosuccinate synthase [Anaerolineales bacterium]|jgi:adenylosuccinate synthase